VISVLIPPRAAETTQPEELASPYPDRDIGRNPDLWLYRGRTISLLRRYLRLSVEVGRLPSLLGREFFRTRITSYNMCTFEDSVIFVHDIDRSLERLDKFSQELIAKIVFQEYSQEETASLLGVWRRTVGRRYHDALDQLSEIFLQGGLLTRLVSVDERPKPCQEGKNGKIRVTDCEDSE
jgi:DNA-directed RNA polymerase specialized sigma24 family protein